MLNFHIFNPELVNIVILPHSKRGVKSNQEAENRTKRKNKPKEVKKSKRK